MQQIILNINNPQIENYLNVEFETKHQTVESLIQEIINRYFEEVSSNNDNKMPVSLFNKLISQSENEYKTNRITEHSDFEKETLKW